VRLEIAYGNLCSREMSPTKLLYQQATKSGSGRSKTAIVVAAGAVSAVAVTGAVAVAFTVALAEQWQLWTRQQSTK
jgi:hypothetical protein